MRDDRRFPEEQYSLAAAEQEGLPAVMMLNLAYAGYEFCGEFPWLASITIRLLDSTDNGLPTNEEGAALNDLQDQFEEILRSHGGFHTVARQSWNFTRVLDYYGADDAPFRRAFAEWIDTIEAPRKATLEMTLDREWSTWAPTLECLTEV